MYELRFLVDAKRSIRDDIQVRVFSSLDGPSGGKVCRVNCIKNFPNGREEKVDG